MRHAPAPRRGPARPRRHSVPASQPNAIQRSGAPVPLIAHVGRARRDRDDLGTGRRLRRFWPAGLTPAGTASYVLASVAVAGLIVIVAALSVAAAGNGRIAAALSASLVTCSGVLALAALTLAVVAGVVATGRHLMPASARVMTQIVHRAVSLVAVGFLAVHILLEVASARSGPLAAVLPFTGARSRFYLGLGTIASDLEIAVVVTSIVRMRYARSGHPRLWRAVHLSIYLAWPLAIVHGLYDQGRPAAWVGWTYLVCVAAVAVAVATRYTMRAPLHRPRGTPVTELPPGLAGPPGRAGPPRRSLSPYGAVPSYGPGPSYGPEPSREPGPSRHAETGPLHRALPSPSYPREEDRSPPWAPAPPPWDLN